MIFDALRIAYFQATLPLFRNIGKNAIFARKRASEFSVSIY